MTWEDIVKMQGKDGKLRDERISDIKTGKNTPKAKVWEQMRKEIEQMISEISVEGDGFEDFKKYSYNAFGIHINRQFNEILDKIEEYRDDLSKFR
tara:strand:+ start:323 stop:607 length:285 start_codon:yes stop_codon:yes gene_type:complete